MPVKLFDSVDAVPEALRTTALETKDGKFAVLEEEDVSGIKAKRDELIRTNRTLSERVKVLGDRTPEEIQADLEFAAQMREKKAKDEGNFEQLKAQLLDQHKGELTKEQGRAKKYSDKLYDVMAKREAEAAIKDLGGDEVVLLPHILPFIKVTEHDDDFSAQVVDSKGNPRIADGQATPMTIKQLVEEFKSNERFGVAFKPSGNNGSGARNNPGGGGSGGKVIIPKDASPQEYRRMKEDAEKRGVPYEVGA